MPRYIDADALLKTAYDCIPVGIVGRQERLLFAEWLINNAPTVSPEEVRGVGRWVRISGYHLDHEYYPARYKCDQCGHFVDSGDGRNYCPRCGAKMEVSEDA